MTVIYTLQMKLGIDHQRDALLSSDAIFTMATNVPRIRPRTEAHTDIISVDFKPSKKKTYVLGGGENHVQLLK